MRFLVTRTASDDGAIPHVLSDVERLDASAASTTRNFVFDQRADGWAINGKAFDPDRVDADPAAGSIEIWRFDCDAHHPIHLHQGHFQVLSRSGEPPRPFDASWKDTVDVLTSQDVRVAVRFADLRGRWVFHCHNLEHEDMEMMATMHVR